VYQGDDHYQKYPDSLFKDEDYAFESRYARVPLKVNQDKLDFTLREVFAFCDFLERIYQDYTGYLKSL